VYEKVDTWQKFLDFSKIAIITGFVYDDDMEEYAPIAQPQFEYSLTNLPKVRERIDFLVDKIILN
jgi:hypothetical protein